MNEPLAGYPLPDDAYTDHDVHSCILPAVYIAPDWLSPTRRSAVLPIGTRWQCGDCKTVHEVVAVSLGRVWRRAGKIAVVCGVALGSTDGRTRCELPPHGKKLFHESTQPDGQRRVWTDNESE